MTRFAYFCGHEQWQPEELVEHAVLAEKAGFDMVVVSEHFHPWVDDQSASGFAFATIGAMAAATSTLEFAQTYYPHVRFGLALTLMNDGYIAHEFGDTWHGNDWWYDELDYDLGLPLGPAERVDLGGDPGDNLVVNGPVADSLFSPAIFFKDIEFVSEFKQTYAP